MVKYIYCITRREGMSREDFQTYWREKHGEFIKGLARTLRATKYVQSHTLDTPINQNIAEGRGLETPWYDGVTEIWWESMDDFIASVSTPEGAEAAKRYIADEANFVDFSKSRAFLTEEYTVFDFAG